MTTELDDRFADMELIRQRLADELHLAVAITTDEGRPDPQVSIVNVGVLDHPASGRPVLALVARRGVKLRNLRRHPRLTLVVRARWEWVAAVGDVELVGPDDPHPHIGDHGRRQLLRDIFHAAGGNHPDLDTYDRVMADERRCAVLVTPDRIWTNPHGSEHRAP
jgi:PPOX class probable F420-dependent enzyme